MADVQAGPTQAPQPSAKLHVRTQRGFAADVLRVADLVEPSEQATIHAEPNERDLRLDAFLRHADLHHPTGAPC